jgi:hypothetical protein
MPRRVSCSLLEVLSANGLRVGAAEAMPRSGAPRVPLQRGIRRNGMEQEGGERDNEPSKFKAMVGNALSCLRFFSFRIGFESRPGH